MRPDIGLGGYRTAGRGAVAEAVYWCEEDGVAISPTASAGPDRGDTVGETAVIRSTTS